MLASQKITSLIFDCKNYMLVDTLKTTLMHIMMKCPYEKMGFVMYASILGLLYTMFFNEEQKQEIQKIEQLVLEIAPSNFLELIQNEKFKVSPSTISYLEGILKGHPQQELCGSAKLIGMLSYMNENFLKNKND